MIEEAIGETREWLATTGVDETIASLQQQLNGSTGHFRI